MILHGIYLVNYKNNMTIARTGNAKRIELIFDHHYYYVNTISTNDYHVVNYARLLHIYEHLYDEIIIIN